MKRSSWKGLRNLLLAGLLLLAAAVVYLRTPRAAEDVCGLARQHLPKLLQLEVSIGSCALDPLTQTVRFRDVSLTEPGAETPLVAADEAEISLGAVSPFFGSVELDRIRITRPRVALDLSRPRPPPSPGACRLDALERVDIGRLEIREAELHLALPGGRAVELIGGEVAWQRRRRRAEIHLTAGG
ncbi:MAG TPA: translocation/assembly module TamB, partial [Myxococcaceae bacterium]|nr:translocation/assembly module TamB [Myxococcaceae bacterium]